MGSSYSSSKKLADSTLIWLSGEKRQCACDCRFSYLINYAECTSRYLLAINSDIRLKRNSSKLRAEDELRPKIRKFEFGKVKLAATVLVMCQMQTPALIRLIHDGLPGLAYGKYEYQFSSVPQLIQGYGEWVQSLFDDGFRMYLVTFKFDHIPGSSEYKRREMLKEVEYQFYPTLIKHVERQPMNPSRQCNTNSTSE